MNTTELNADEQKAAAAFSKQAKGFDDYNSSNTIVQYKRERVRAHVSQYILPGDRILELNSGTGEDAVWLAKLGHQVHATDISAAMQELLINKIQRENVADKVTHELCSFTKLNQLKRKGPYDLVFSNFAGLNCTDDLKTVLQSLGSLLKPGGLATLVILPKFSLWESLLFLRGKFKTATRRFFSKNGTKAHIEGEYFRCWYYNPSYVIEHTKQDFDVLQVEGLCSIVPPSYIERFPEKYPGIFKFLKKKEETLRNKWPWKNIGDYYIISLRKKH